MADLDTLRPEVRDAVNEITFTAASSRPDLQKYIGIIRAELVRLEDECAMHRKFMWMLLKAAGDGSVTFRASTWTPGKHND